MATKKKRGTAQPPSSADIRGVETFDTEESAILVLDDVERVAGAFAKQTKAKVWKRGVLGKTVTITDPCYIVLRMSGHRWTLVVPCTSGKSSSLKQADAKTLSRILKTTGIYFANSDCAGYTEYELFHAGKAREHFRCFEDVEFTSQVRDVDPPADGPEVYDFVNRFMREQDAFVPACSLHLNTGWMKAGEKVKLAPQYILPEVFERLDFVAVRAGE